MEYSPETQKLFFAVYLHKEVLQTSKPPDQIQFIGKSQPFLLQVREELVRELPAYPGLPLRKTAIEEYLRVHTKTYIKSLKALANEAREQNQVKLSIDCSGLEYCLPGYQYSLGGMFEAVDRMKEGMLDRAYCMSLGGHHAHADWGHGYCLLNPMAAAAKYAQESGFKKILIVDWDIHHGNGTQSVFSRDPGVYCISIHSGIDLYMSKAAGLHTGTTVAGSEAGHCNIPVVNHDFSDEQVRELGLEGNFYRPEESLQEFRKALEQVPWKPEMIMVYAGYDSHRDDCGMSVTDWTEEDYRTLTRDVISLARKSGCPILSVHGSGYNLPGTIASAKAHIDELSKP